MPTFRIIISAPDSVENFTIDTLVENVADENEALQELIERTPPADGKLINRPIQKLRAVRD